MSEKQARRTSFVTPEAEQLSAKEVGQKAVGRSVGALKEVGRQLHMTKATQAAYEQLRQAMSGPQHDVAPHAAAFELEPGGDLRGLDLIVGVALGSSDVVNELPGEPGEACIHLYTSEAMKHDEAVNYAITAYDAQKLSDTDACIKVIHTGPIDMLAHRFRMRPAPGGISLGHSNITAGTLGCVARGRSAPRDSRMLVLSNNHVLADVNKGSIGDAILQPGPYDGGAAPGDQIGVLERYVTIDFTKDNYVDCATAWVEPNAVRKELMYIKGGQASYFNVGSKPVAAKVNMVVGKSGRTTQLRAGRIMAVGATVRVNMGGGRVARFVDQISIQGVNGDFSQGGDSGSLVWTWDEARAPVGLLFAGGGGYTFVNPIQYVLNALDIDLYT